MCSIVSRVTQPLLRAVSDIHGRSARRMIKGLLAGETPQEVQTYVCKRAQDPWAQSRRACTVAMVGGSIIVPGLGQGLQGTCNSE